MIHTETKTADQQIGQRAKALYERDILPQIKETHHGEYLTLDVDTGQYVVGPDDLAVMQEALKRFPNGTRFGFRVGYPAVYSLRGGGGPRRPMREVVL